MTKWTSVVCHFADVCKWCYIDYIYVVFDHGMNSMEWVCHIFKEWAHWQGEELCMSSSSWCAGQQEPMNYVGCKWMNLLRTIQD